MSIESELTRIDRQIEKVILERDALQVRVDECQERIRGYRALKLEKAQEGLERLGLTVDIRQNEVTQRQSRSPSRCSICVEKGLAGTSHTAASHHVLLVRGEIPGLPSETDTPAPFVGTTGSEEPTS